MSEPSRRDSVTKLRELADVPIVDCVNNEFAASPPQDSQTEEEFNEHEKYSKIINVILRLMKAVKQHGVQADAFAKEVGEVMTFMALAPEIGESILPEFIKSAKSKVALARAEPGPPFWNLLRPEPMRVDAFPPKQVAAKLTEVIADKIVALQDWNGRGACYIAAVAHACSAIPGTQCTGPGGFVD